MSGSSNNNDARRSSDHSQSGADELFGLPNSDAFDFDNIFDFNTNLDSSIQPSEQHVEGHGDTFNNFVAPGDTFSSQIQTTKASSGSQNNVQFTSPFSTEPGNFGQAQIIDPSLMPTNKIQQSGTPRYRTDSGSELPAIWSADGKWLHPRNYRQLDDRELRWDGQSMVTAAPANYVQPTPQTSTYDATQSTFDPMLSTLPMSEEPAYSYPDPTTFDSAGYAPINQPTDLDTVVPSIEVDETRSPSPQRRRSSDKAGKISRRQPLYHMEAPEADRSRPWVRINSATKGNTRTGKTNAYGDGPYRKTVHPFGVDHPQWTASNGTVFKYNQWGELNGVSFGAEDIRHYLYEHPFLCAETRSKLPQEQQDAIVKSNAKLIIWIQKMPGDSAKRVNTQHGLKCRIRECPAGIYKTRTINTGHYRVAFDEQWNTHAETRNPMHVAAYAHLYCMERFFQFSNICHDFDVRSDDRQIPSEPTGEWVAGLGQGTEEYKMARDFIHAAKTGKGAENWITYPGHNLDRPTARKLPHCNTLVHHMVDRKAASTGNSKMRMMKERGESATQFFVNMGDLQLQIDTQQDRNAQRALHSKGRSPLKRRMVDADEQEAEESGAEDGYESPGADNGDPDDDYTPHASKRSKRMVGLSSSFNAIGANDDDYQAASVGPRGRRRSSERIDENVNRNLRTAVYGVEPRPQAQMTAPVAQMVPIAETSAGNATMTVERWVPGQVDKPVRRKSRKRVERSVSPKTVPDSPLFVEYRGPPRRKFGI